MTKKICIVLGPHRSGTSLLAAAIESLGAYLGVNYNNCSEENPKGFFENEAIVHFNDRLLEFLGGRWDNPLFDGRDAIRLKSTEDIKPWYIEADKLLHNAFNGHDFVGIKDPRMCQLLPFWFSALPRNGYYEDNTYLVHICRHPIEVAQSQHKRRRLNPEFYFLGDNLMETVSLWFSLSHQSLRDLGSDRNIFLLYSHLLRDPRGQIQRLAEFLGVSGHGAKIDEFCNRFVDRDLRRNIAGSADTKKLLKQFPEAHEFYLQQRELASLDIFSRQDTKKALQVWEPSPTEERFLKPLIPVFSELANQRLFLSKIRNTYDQIISELKLDRDRTREQYEATISELQLDRERAKDKFMHELRTMNAEIHRLKENVASREETLNVLTHTLSWRITKPLRQIRSIQKNASNTLILAWFNTRNSARRHNNLLSQRAPLLHKLISPILRPLYRIVDQPARKLHYDPPRVGTVSNRWLNDCAHTEYQRSTSHILDKQPLVSIIVPNYNHAPYLAQRLDSIYNQSYRNFEVILLDDCSQDSSQEILEHYYRRYPNNTRLLLNKVNSGGVFFQWEKGISEASGDLIWIAESDDWCDTSFLSELIKFFSDDAVMLAYSKTAFMRGDKNEQIWSIEEYLSDIDSSLWSSPFACTAHQLVNAAWAIKNIIPNVSSALFRKSERMALLSEDFWKRMSICGDWMFFLHIVRGGLVAYTNMTTNYYRIHDKNTSVATYSKDIYYEEHELIAQHINSLYEVPDVVFLKQKEHVKQHWIMNRPIHSEDQFRQCYSVERIVAAKEQRKPNLLMASYAFAAGGGETFPIQLANSFKAFGYSVTFLSCEQEERQSEVRKMLHPDIPVVTNLISLNTLVTDFNIEIIHSHHAWVDNTIIDLLPLNSRCQTVVSLHGMYEMMSDSDLKRVLPRLVYRTGQFVYAAEKNLYSFKKLRLFNAKKFRKIDNALEGCPITPVNLKDLGISADAFVLCLVSRAIPEKGWKESIEAVERARKLSGRDIQLLLIGEGPEYDFLRNNGHPDFVHLLGFRENIRDYYAASDLGFLPSRFKGESFPLTIIDCLHSGKPVLASEIGEIRSMLQVGRELAGCLFPLKDWQIPIKQLAEVIAKCATEPLLYQNMMQAVLDAAARFDPIVMRDKYDAIYTQLLMTQNSNGNRHFQNKLQVQRA